jgi:hypothetical protein
VVKTAVWNAEGVTEDVAVYDKSEGAILRVFCIYGKGKYCNFDFPPHSKSLKRQSVLIPSATSSTTPSRLSDFLA